MSKLVREKQDAEQFIRQIAPEYLGVYVVDRETDEFREILAPEYFRLNAEENGGCFSKAMEDYIASMVALRYHNMVEQVLDYDRVYIQLKAGMDVEVYYRRLDDVPIKLQIKPYSDKKEEQNLSLWIFINDDTGGAQMKRFQRDKLIMDKLCYDFTAVYYIDLNTGSFTRVVLRAWATENTFSLGTSPAVRTDTTGAVPPVQRTVPVTVRTGATHSFRA